MSIEALSWAFNLDLPSSGAKLTLLALANYSSESGEAFPSQKAMAQKTCLCERAIRTHLVTLEDLGLIGRVGRTRANGSFTSDLFKLNIGALPSGKICQRQNLPEEEITETQRQILPNPAAEYAAPDPSLNTTITKSLKPTALATRLPADWTPTNEDLDFCKTTRPDLSASFVADGFKDYWISVAGAKGRKLDWAATWRNWIRRQQAPSVKTKQAGRDQYFAEAAAARGNENGNRNERDITGEAQRVA